MDAFTWRFGKAFDFLKSATITSRTTDAELSLGSVFEKNAFVGFYFYNDRNVLCQTFNDYLCKFIANEEHVKLSTDVEQLKGYASFLSIVCILPDQGAAAFQQAVTKVPWHVLERSQTNVKMKLQRIFRVRRLPAFALIRTSDMLVCSVECCKEIQEDPTGSNFPWTPKKLNQVCTGALVSKTNSVVSFETLPKGYKGYLFAAQWCPPCRTFVGKLQEVYKRAKASNNTFEIIFCSQDRSAEAFQRFYGEMPWLAVPFNDPRLILIAKSLHVQEIPSFLIVDEDYNLINRYGKMEVQLDPLAKEFPWHPRSVVELSDQTVSRLREDVALILFAEGNQEDLLFAQNVLLPIAEEYLHEQREPEIIFFYAADDSVSERVLAHFDLLDSALPLICICDPFSDSIYICDHPSVSEEIIRQFLTKFNQNQLTGRPSSNAKMAYESHR